MLNSIYSIQFYLESEDSIAIDFHQHFSFQCDFFKVIYKWNSGFPDGSGVKYLPATAGDAGLIPGSWRSPGTGMATHSSIHVWRIPWTEEPVELQSMGLQRVRRNWVTNTFIPPWRVCLDRNWRNHLARAACLDVSTLSAGLAPVFVRSANWG